MVKTGKHASRSEYHRQRRANLPPDKKAQVRERYV